MKISSEWEMADAYNTEFSTLNPPVPTSFGVSIFSGDEALVVLMVYVRISWP